MSLVSLSFYCIVEPEKQNQQLILIKKKCLSCNACGRDIIICCKVHMKMEVSHIMSQCFEIKRDG